MENLRKKFVDRFTTNSTTGAVSSNNLSNNDDTVSNHSGSYNESTLRQFWMPDQGDNHVISTGPQCPFLGIFVQYFFFIQKAVDIG